MSEEKTKEEIKEIWKDIKDYEGIYKISNYGNVFSLKRDKILKPGISNKYYHVSLSKNGEVKPKKIHRIVTEHFSDDWDEKLQVDHIDGDRLNNNISNLRMATSSQNNSNRKIQKNNTSGYRGVFICENKKYQARIKKEGKIITKCFDKPTDAARFYNENALLLHGEFARPNIIIEDDE